MEFRELTELQLDALREVGNIGAGNAATALSQMVQKRIDMTIPQVEILPLEKIVSKIGEEEEEVIAIVLRVLGDAPGNMVFLLTVEGSYRLMEMLTGRQPGGKYSELEISALQEIGNILTGAYLNAIVKLTGLMLISSVPAVSSDMLSSLMTTVFVESGQYDEYMMYIDAKFSEGDTDIKGHFFYIPMPGSLEKIMEALGLMQ